MSKVQRNLDGVYFRVRRDGTWQSVCYSDMTAGERESTIYDRMADKPLEEQAAYYRRLAELMADQLYDMGEQLGVVCERPRPTSWEWTMAEYVVKGAEPNETVLHTQTPNGYEEWRWLPVCEEIVRCRDCKHYSEHEWILITDVSDVCHFWHGKPTKVEPDGFCAWGERKEEQ